MAPAVAAARGPFFANEKGADAIGSLRTTYQITIRREPQTFRDRHTLMMFPSVTLLAKQLQVVKTQGNLRIIDVIRRQINLMVHDLTAGTAPLTQTVPGRDVSLPRLLPRLRFVKLACPRFHMITLLGARRAPRPGVSGEPRGLGHVSKRAVPDKIYFAKGSAGCSSSMRLRMISQYSGSRSMPMALRPVLKAATSVVPEPAKGSNTISPGREIGRAH